MAQVLLPLGSLWICSCQPAVNIAGSSTVFPVANAGWLTWMAFKSPSKVAVPTVLHFFSSRSEGREKALLFASSCDVQKPSQPKSQRGRSEAPATWARAYDQAPRARWPASFCRRTSPKWAVTKNPNGTSYICSYRTLGLPFLKTTTTWTRIAYYCPEKSISPHKHPFKNHNSTTKTDNEQYFSVIVGCYGFYGDVGCIKWYIDFSEHIFIICFWNYHKKCWYAVWVDSTRFRTLLKCPACRLLPPETLPAFPVGSVSLVDLDKGTLWRWRKGACVSLRRKLRKVSKYKG